MATVHRLTGIAAALGVVFVESVVVTYFIGTSRWCKEVAETYRLDAAPVRESNRLKRRAFAVALVGMLTVVGVIALGAAADPATGRPNTQAWTNFHLVGCARRVRGDRLDVFRRLAICLANQRDHPTDRGRSGTKFAASGGWSH